MFQILQAAAPKKPIFFRWLFSWMVLPFLLFSCNKPAIDLLVTNAVIYTVDSAFSRAEAMAIKDGKILETGTAEMLKAKYKATETLNAQGKYVYPGFIDAHCHFMGYAQGLAKCDLTATNSWAEILQRLTDFTKQDGAGDTSWIIGRGWDQNDWANKAFPTNADLNRMFPNRPVFLTRVDGHAAIANQKALQMAGVKAGQAISGGLIVSQSGVLTGILVDNATDLVESLIPAESSAKLLAGLQKAEANCFAAGLTSVQDCGLDYGTVEKIRQLFDKEQLRMRMYVMLSDKADNYRQAFEKGKIETPQLHVCAFKLYADGALGSRGACLLEPYSDAPLNSGFLLREKAHFDSVLPVIASKGWQACTHAIGDSANRTILNIYGKVLAGKPGLRWRIEHAQVINQADFALFSKGGVIPSVQPTHATSDMYWAADRLGENRVKGAYAYRQLLLQLGWLPLGTDFPVEDISPLKTFYAAAVRKDAKGYPENGFQMENVLSREETLRGMTVWAAKAAFEDHQKGSLESGKYADFIVLDRDLMTCEDNKILNTNVLQTWLGGKRVFSH